MEYAGVNRAPLDSDPMETNEKELGRMPTPAITDPDDRDSIDWDELQVDVISAPSDARILVDAGPGTGKTAVACGRVAALIDDQGVAPANIWLISFTRTAVREIRNRIREYLDDPADAHSVRIATIDAQAWAIHSGFVEGASLTGSYEENIQTVTELAENHEGVFEYLDTVEHLIIDEAQDIVGVRAKFICALVKQLNSNCGVTVFADEAQAIYGFASETDDSYRDEELLTSRLRSVGGTQFQDKSLSRIYRTDQKKLKNLYTEVREQVLAPYSVTGEGKLARVTQMIRALADGEDAVVDELSDSDPEGLLRTFVLFRRRVDVLNAASFWGIRPHRLRMGGLPVITESWLGVVCWDFTDKRLARVQFENLWADRVDRSRLTEISCEGAWRLLVQVAGESETSVSMQMLRSRLGAGVPPTDFLRQDFGLGGPVFGTIHGCKGREADTVLLLLPEDRRVSDGDDEEARVVFVGATRARAELRVGKGARYLKARTVRNRDRAYTLQTREGKPSARVEVGRLGDIQADGIAGRAVFDGPDEVLKAQAWLIASARDIRAVKAATDPDREWRYEVRPDDGPVIGYLSQQFGFDLFDVGRGVGTDLKWNSKLRAASGLNHLKSFGSGSIVLGPEDPVLPTLHEPWSRSGFLLTPVIQGFDMVYFKTYR